MHGLIELDSVQRISDCRRRSGDYMWEGDAAGSEWSRTTLKLGDKITVTFNPMRNGDNGGMFLNGNLTNGKVLTMSGAQ